MSDRIEKLRAGAARCPGQSYGDLLSEETRAIPPFMQQESYQYKGSEPLAASRYTSAAFFRQEIEKMWPNVWQFAARDEEMPDPGDYVVYENAGRSYLLTRQEDGSVKAFHNVCLHRGRKLRTESGYADQFRCPFHGFTWNTDGALKEIPCRWDFGHLKNENMGLPEAKVAWWGGYLFIREAEEGPTIEEYLAPLPEFFTRWNHADCVTTSWVGKVIHANWKTTMEAFVEAWHVIETHPQLIPFTGDANTRYNTWGDNANLAITAFATPSPHIDPASVTTRWVADRLVEYNTRPDDPPFELTLAENQTARQAVAELNREYFSKMFDYDYSDATDAEMIDAFTFNVFPNFAPWGGHMPHIVYRYRPWPDENHTLMEVRFLRRVPKDTPRPRSVPMKFLSDTETFSAAKDLGPLADVLDQDLKNLPYIQEGLRVSKTNEVNLGNYQEIRIRHFHQTLDKYLAK